MYRIGHMLSLCALASANITGNAVSGVGRATVLPVVGAIVRNESGLWRGWKTANQLEYREAEVANKK
jgi:hypothetical protein